MFKTALTIAFLLFSPALTAQEADFRPVPEAATDIQDNPRVAIGKDYMAVTANPFATQTAADILSRGGTVADAIVSVQAILGLVEPQSSGLGGGAFILYYDAKRKKLHSYDARETAPYAATANMFMGEDDKPLPFYQAMMSGKSVGVPGVPMFLDAFHRSYGTLPWRSLLNPAKTMAYKGFPISQRLAYMIAEEHQERRITESFKQYFLTADGSPPPAGAVLVNLEYAETLHEMQEARGTMFYDDEFPLAQNIAATVSENGGYMTLADLENYRVFERFPVCAPYREYTVCSMGEPSSGGLTVLLALGILEKFPLGDWGPSDRRSWHVLAEASRVAFADRNKYMSDPGFKDREATFLLEPDYIEERAYLVNPNRVNRDIQPGNPGTENGTSHISLIDRYGNILAMTSSVESAFGSHLMVGGFVLNNQLTDFAFEPNDENGVPKNNKVEGGKRPRSSMAPTIIFDGEGRPFMTLGSAGGSRIIGYVLQRIVSVIDWGMSLEEAVQAPSILARSETLEVEEGARMSLTARLQSGGYKVDIGKQTSGLTAILITHDEESDTVEYTGVADPRREGTAAGE